MMLDPPPSFALYFILGLGFCVLFGVILSSSSVWNQLFKKGEYELYLKRGEYGETESKARKWSPFEEPLNAWTSFAYTVLGFVIFFTGVHDSLILSSAAVNNITQASGFSLLYGASTIYLGIASMLFHASHAETWRKADAGMTSGVVIAPLVFGLWDHLRPPAAGTTGMIIAAAVLQLSLTHGYLPYGSSDILLPSFVAMLYVIEFLPRYGGAFDSAQYVLWLQGLLAVLVALLLRLADVKRANDKFRSTVMNISFGLIIVAAATLGLTDYLFWALLVAWLVVSYNVSLGHVCWHIGSAYSLFMWWYMLRTRPGNVTATDGALADSPAITILFCFSLKNAVRRLAWAVPFPTDDHRNRCFFFVEHIFFVAFGYYVTAILPEQMSEGSSWLNDSKKFWVRPVYPTPDFHLYYLAKVGAHSEDLVMMAVEWYRRARSVGDATPAHSDSKMVLHHIVTAALCIFSWLAGYSRVGSAIMFLHDITDVPLDAVRIGSLFDWKLFLMVTTPITIVTWLYWRYTPFQLRCEYISDVCTLSGCGIYHLP